MAKIVKTRSFKSTWRDRRAVITTHHLDNRRLGLRICVMQYEGSDSSSVQLINGDGRAPSFKVISDLTVPNGEVAQAVEHLERTA